MSYNETIKISDGIKINFTMYRKEKDLYVILKEPWEDERIYILTPSDQAIIFKTLKNLKKTINENNKNI